jgi:hypothetical protein
MIAVAAVALLIGMQHVVVPIVLYVVVPALLFVVSLLALVALLAAWLAIPVGFLYAVDRLVLAIERRGSPAGRRPAAAPPSQSGAEPIRVSGHLIEDRPPG